MKGGAEQWLLLAAVAFVIFSLLKGATYLLWVLPGGVPLGNALVVIGLLSASLFALRQSVSASKLRWLALLSLVASIAWYPLSIALAGNLTLTFRNDVNSSEFVALSSVTAMLVITALIWSLVNCVGFNEKSRN